MERAMIPRFRAWDKEFKEMVQVDALVFYEQIIKATYKNGNVVKEDITYFNDALKCDKVGKALKKDIKNGIVEVKGFNLHIDEDKIPKDMSNGMCISNILSWQDGKD